MDTFLATCAQLGVALAGFAGLLSAFRHSERPWLPQEVAGMKLIIEHAFSVSGFALLPFVLAQVHSSPAVSWRLCSGLLAAFLVCDLALQNRRIKRLVHLNFPPRRGRALRLIFAPVTGMFAILQAVALIDPSRAWPFAAGLVWLLATPGIQFYHFVLETPVDTTPKALLKDADVRRDA